MIPNHYAARLSALDLEVISHVPEGGNWKNIPTTVPSQRLDQIRASFARGEGSRSTYYGRLRRDAPSYTINTYFTRPGNGCHIHYEQDRVLTHREAARLQSFPDDFVFAGKPGRVAVQIGNAVPPLLAYQIALSFGEPGEFVDLFAGAGGLSLGFVWAGWKSLVANDIDERALETYAQNIDEEVVLGDIRDADVARSIVERAATRRTPGRPFLVIGGPPCQGFSTAGHRRSTDDERNHLFLDYRRLLDDLSPDGFVFENVMGLLNMQRGTVFQAVTSILGKAVESLDVWTVQAERYGLPQRRSRVIIVGTRGRSVPPRPQDITAYPAAAADDAGVSTAPSVSDAISDLPKAMPGEDASAEPYLTDPSTEYQRLIRGLITPSGYVRSLALESMERSVQLRLSA